MILLSLHTLTDPIIISGAAVAALVTLIATFSKVWKLAKKVSSKVDLLDSIPDIKKDIASIRTELTTNGGSSLKDEIYRQSADMEKHNRNISTKLRRMDNRVKRIEDANQDQSNN